MKQYEKEGLRWWRIEDSFDQSLNVDFVHGETQVEDEKASVRCGMKMHNYNTEGTIPLTLYERPVSIFVQFLGVYLSDMNRHLNNNMDSPFQ
eukprot:m.53387 g.53387  ORF g.53387 m.53387 type:complete len:92 (+) comp10865_c0_seq2:1180-1455(+)